MMAGPKFFIYGGKRWREIDTNTGRVAGWGAVQFLSVQNRRLEVARKTSVLRGLRNLAASKPTTVHDGLPLLQIRHPKAIEDKIQNVCHDQHHCCCRQQTTSKTTNNDKTIKASTCSAAIQCSLTQTIPQIHIVPSNDKTQDKFNLVYPKIKLNQKVKRLLKRKRSISEDEGRKTRKVINISSDDTNDLTILESRDRGKEKRKHSSDDEDDERDRSSKIAKVTESPQKTKSLKKINKYADDVSKKTSSTNNKNISHNSPNKNKRTLRSSVLNVSSDESVISPSIISDLKYNKLSKKKSYDGLKNNKNRRNSRNEKGQFKRKIFNFSIDSDSSNSVETVQVQTKAQMHAIPTDGADDNNRNRADKNRTIKHKHNNDTKKDKNASSDKTSKDFQREPFKELLIEEDDIMLLRDFVEKDNDNVFKVDLERFDADDVYKAEIFYKLNPLVNVVRCKRIANMLKEKSDGDVSLEDFMSHLGLRSILDTSSQASSKYRMRSRNKTQKLVSDKENIKVNGERSGLSNVKSGLNKVKSGLNNVKSGPRNVRSGLNKVKSVPSNVKSDLSKNGSSKVKTAEVLEVSSGSEDFRGKKKSDRAKRGKSVIAVKRGLKKPSRVNREYSRAEDEAIVTWLRREGRAGRVKGNQLWMELQPLHQQTTGHFRSWHSLRNRYLRYLLPALGALSLPPHEASRLRAAAAAGEIKSRKVQRRNSILVQPRVQSAWSRRPRPSLHSPSPSRTSPSRNSPIRILLNSANTRKRTPQNPTRDTNPSKNAPPFHSSRDSSARVSPNSSDSSGIDSESDLSARSIHSHKKSKESSGSRDLVKRSLRSNGVSTPTTRTNAQIPTYSELTKKFAKKHDELNDSRQLRRRLTDTDRHSDRHTPTDRHKPRTRRLYNPNAI